jgi:hypothetical protein
MKSPLLFILAFQLVLILGAVLLSRRECKIGLFPLVLLCLGASIVSSSLTVEIFIFNTLEIEQVAYGKALRDRIWDLAPADTPLLILGFVMQAGALFGIWRGYFGRSAFLPVFVAVVVTVLAILPGLVHWFVGTVLMPEVPQRAIDL